MPLKQSSTKQDRLCARLATTLICSHASFVCILSAWCARVEISSRRIRVGRWANIGRSVREIRSPFASSADGSAVEIRFRVETVGEAERSQMTVCDKIAVNVRTRQEERK